MSTYTNRESDAAPNAALSALLMGAIAGPGLSLQDVLAETSHIEGEEENLLDARATVAPDAMVEQNYARLPGAVLHYTQMVYSKTEAMLTSNPTATLCGIAALLGHTAEILGVDPEVVGEIIKSEYERAQAFMAEQERQGRALNVTISPIEYAPEWERPFIEKLAQETRKVFDAVVAQEYLPGSVCTNRYDESALVLDNKNGQIVSGPVPTAMDALLGSSECKTSPIGDFFVTYGPVGALPQFLVSPGLGGGFYVARRKGVEQSASLGPEGSA